MIAAAVQKFALEQLPGRFDAEERIEQAIRSSRPLCPVALAVDYYPVIVDHFGFEGGDEALSVVARRLPAARLYRWAGAAFLVVLETNDAARLLLNAIPDRYAVRFRADGEVVEIPYSVRSKVFASSPADTAPDLSRRIDRWVATPWLD